MKLFFIAYRFFWFLIIPILLRIPRLREGADERCLKKISFAKVDIWIHAASVGEAYMARQIVQSLSPEKQLKILITTNTRQGRNILEKDFVGFSHSLTVSYMVFDAPSFVKKALQLADPKVLVLIELEIWPALLAEIKRRRRKIIIVNGRMTAKSFKGYMRTARLWRNLVPDVILAISEADKSRFLQLFQLQQIQHIANIKFDRLQTCTISEKDNSAPQSLVLASIRKEEEDAVLFIIENILTQFKNLQIDLFPRHQHRITSWQEHLKSSHISYAIASKSPLPGTCSVIIQDVFGELTKGYQRADAAFVGGSLADLGGQNFVEAFMNGVIPVTGPSIFNFLWTGEEVFDNGLVQKATDKEEALQFLSNLLKNPPDKRVIQKKANNYIRSKQGGTEETCRQIEALL